MEYGDKRILYIDFSAPFSFGEVGGIVEKARTAITREPIGSVLTLTDFTGSMHVPMQSPSSAVRSKSG